VQPGCSVVIVGSGPIGLAALLTAQLYSPSEITMIDLDDKRLEVAMRFGATHVINSTDGLAVDKLMALTGGRGADTVIEAVGIAATFELCEKLLAAGGTLANIGVHGAKADLHLENLWDRNITITTRLVDTVSTPTLLQMVKSNRMDPLQLVTHHYALADVLQAYESFEHAAHTGALKVIIDVS
jgi:alcohol dehydrogenase